MSDKPGRRSILQVPALLALIQGAGVALALATDGLDMIFAAMVAVPLCVIMIMIYRS